MIETTFITIEQAARQLGCETDTLRIAAIERRMQLYGLLNRAVWIEKGEWVSEENEETEGENLVWIPHSKERSYLAFIPIYAANIGNLMQGVPVEMSTGYIYEPDGQITEFTCIGRRPAPIRGDLLFMKKDEVAEILDSSTPPKQGSSGNDGRNLEEKSQSHITNQLIALNKAAQRWWANADPSDPSTHPKNANVAAWLKDRGYSQSQAEKAASIIRPDWAHAGRKPDL